MAGWSRCPGAPEIHRGQKHFFYNPAVEISGEEKSDLIQVIRIEHSADQAKCPDWQVRRGYSGSLCQCSASLHGDSISQQTGTAAVAAGIYVGNVTAVFRQMIPDKIQCQMQVSQLVIEETVRYQPVLNAEYQIPRLTKGGTKGRLNSLFPMRRPPPCTLTMTGRISPSRPLGR